MKRFAATVFAVLVSTTCVLAQVQVDKSRPFPKRGQVGIENAFGSIKIIAWDKEEISVTGVLAPGAEGLDMSYDKEQAWIDVEIPDSWFYVSDDDTSYQSHLEIRIPKGCELDVESVNATIDVSGVNGSIEIESVNGSVTISSDSRELDIETVTGDVSVDVSSAVIEVESVSGSVRIRGAAGKLQVNTLSGSIDVAGRGLHEIDLETTAGTVDFSGTVTGEGSLEAESFSGAVNLVFTPDVAAQFELTTFEGRITSALGPPPRKESQFNPYQEARFRTGMNEFEIEVKTYSGNISISVDPEAGRPAR